MFLVSVKVQCVNMRVFVKSTKAVYTITRITFAHNSKNSEFALQCFLKARIAFLKITSLASTEQ
jgi:hypothetical protein